MWPMMVDYIVVTCSKGRPTVPLVCIFLEMCAIGDQLNQTWLFDARDCSHGEILQLHVFIIQVMCKPVL